MVARLAGRTVPWDFVVIGGGATGVGVAVDAASRGYSVAAARAERLRQGHLQPQHQAGARRRALSRTGQHRRWSWGRCKERGLLRQRAAPGPRRFLSSSPPTSGGNAVLRRRPEDLQTCWPAGAASAARRSCRGRSAGAGADAATGRAPRRRPLLRRPVRRCAAVDRPGADRGGARRGAAQLRRASRG